MESKTYCLFIESPVGIIKLISNKLSLLSIQFEKEPGLSDTDIPDILIDTKFQLEEYFSGKRKSFDLQLKSSGTDFQQKVWEEVKKVGFGTTQSYLDISLKLGSEKFTRAVGMANGKNPIPIIIPCHRIIGSDGKLTGYAGGLERKKWLLLHEQRLSISVGLFQEK